MGGGIANEMWMSDADEHVREAELQRLIWDELEREPTLDPRDVRVEVSDTIATLTGTVRSYPEKLVAARPPEAFLNEGRDGLVNQLKGTLKDEQAITIDGYPGKSYTVSSDNGEVKARNFLVGPRLYTLLVLYNPSIGAPAADAFLTSLKLVNPPPPVERAVPGGADAGTDGGTVQGADMGADAGVTPDAGTPRRRRAK